MEDLIEIRWHGRGGQGAKTAALLLADVAFSTGMHVQGFPEYGPERMGAPITAYNRISSKVIRVHSNIYESDCVAIVDESLIGAVDVLKGLKPTGSLVINTRLTGTEIRKKLGGYTGRLHVVDARTISEKCLGRYFPNTPMLAAVAAVSGILDEESLVREMRKSFEHKFASKPEMVNSNMEALVMTLREVKNQ